MEKAPHEMLWLAHSTRWITSESFLQEVQDFENIHIHWKKIISTNTMLLFIHL